MRKEFYIIFALIAATHLLLTTVPVEYFYIAVCVALFEIARYYYRRNYGPEAVGVLATIGYEKSDYVKSH